MNITYRDAEFDVDYTYHKATRGHRDSYGFQYEPDEPAEIELNAVKWKGTDVFDLLDELYLIDEVEEAVWKEIDNDEPYYD